MKKVKRLKCFLLSSLIFSLVLFESSAIVLAAAQMKTPEQHFGFKPGAERMLFTYEELTAYLQLLDAASPRLKMQEIGFSPLGKKMYLALFSAEENINNIESLKIINKKLALEANLPESEKKDLIKNGKVFVLATLSMHSDEVAPAQSAPLIAYDLVTTDDEKKLAILKDVVYMMVPCHNPDGMDMVVNYYNKTKGTKYEGSSLPGVYHKYVGHDNNRDFVTLSQSDNRAISDIFSSSWFPQVFVEKHQMGYSSARYFVPPVHDPIAENIDAGVWNWTWIFGSRMVTDMTKAGLAGVSQHYLFDDYWPGSTETCIWKNVIGMLTEAASCQYAKPIFVEPNELRASGKGLAEYKKSINMSLPWTGGWWRLSDIVQYEIVSTMSILNTAFLFREEILKFRNDLCQREVKRGQSEPPYYFILPLEQHDKSELVALANLLLAHGVKIFQLTEPYIFDHRNYQPGDIVVPLAQPFRPFVKEVLEEQQFPVRHYTPSGQIIEPYDITSWSLPLHRGVKSIEIKERSEKFEALLSEIKGNYSLAQTAAQKTDMAIFPVENNESFKAAFTALKNGLLVERIEETAKVGKNKISQGSFVVQVTENNQAEMQQLLDELNILPVYDDGTTAIKKKPVPLPRLAIVETYFHDMDAGWTRFVLDSYRIPFTVLRPGDFEKSDLAKNFDVIIFPDQNKSILMEGKYKSDGDYHITSYAPEYTKGIGKKGMEKLMTFLVGGGIIIAWGESVNLFSGPLEIKISKEEKEDFELPFRNISETVKKAGLSCPGALMKINLIKDHVLTLGMEESVGVFFSGEPVLATSMPNFDMDRRVIAKFPEKDMLLSGYCEKEENLSNKSAMIWLKKGKGQLVLFGFSPQFRASTNATYKLLFNSILLPKIR